MNLKIIIRSMKPFYYISLITTYFLGAGLVQYVRKLTDWSFLIQVLLFQLLVTLCIDLLNQQQNLLDKKNWPEKITVSEVRQIRWVIVLISATLLTTITTLFITWMVNDILWQGLSVLLILYAVLAGFYFWTKINPKFHPFLLFLEVVQFVILPPALAFFSQSNEPHLLLTLIIISLVPAFLAYQLLIQIKNYGKDMQNDVSSLVVQVGWEKGMVYHNALILLTYVLFAFIAILGFPWFLLWPVFLTLPIGLVEIWLMERTRRGGKPLWRVMQLATLSVFFIPIYLIGFAFWIR